MRARRAPGTAPLPPPPWIAVAGALTIACLATAPAAGQQPNQPPEPLITDRPDFTESTAAVSRLQIESGYTYARSGRTDEHSVGEILLRVPLARGSELRIGVNSLVWSPERDDWGLEDASLGVKLGVAAGGEGWECPSLALLVGATLPTGSDAFGEEEVQPDAILALGWELGERTALGSNLGYAYAAEDGNRFSQFAGSLAVGYTLTDRVGAYLETFGFAPLGEENRDTAFLDGGTTYLLTPDLQFDARIGTSLDGADPDFFFGLGVSRRW